MSAHSRPLIGEISGETATRFSPLHNVLAAQGAQFDVSLGWPYPLRFNGASNDGTSNEGTSNEGDDESQAVREEHLATRSSVGVFDVSLLTKLTVEGTDACSVLDRRSTASIDVPVGTVVYTPWCDDDGMVVADLSIIRVAADRFVLTATEMLREQLLDELRVLITDTNAVVADVTEDFALLSVQGPKSKALLERLTDTSLSIGDFDLFTAQSLRLADVDVLAVRMTFTGDCGWELHVPARQAVAMYQRLFAAANTGGNQEISIRNCGVTAMHTCGAEKGYLDMAEHVTEPLNAFEANFAFAVDVSPERNFPGDVRLRELAVHEPKRRMILVRCDEELTKGDRLLHNSVKVGLVTWAAFGSTVRSWVGFAFVESSEGVDEHWLASGNWSVESGHQQHSLEVGLTAWFDPDDTTILL
jgi:glycine cleavage system aminomethyltransferase T